MSIQQAVGGDSGALWGQAPGPADAHLYDLVQIMAKWPRLAEEPGMVNCSEIVAPDGTRIAFGRMVNADAPRIRGSVSSINLPYRRTR